LVVDDDPAIREALTAALTPPFVVHTAASGEAAREVLRGRAISAIILDAVLGDEDGIALVPDFHRLSTAPILVLTGHGSEALAVQAFRAGVQEYLNKPPNLSELYARLDTLIAPRRTRDPVEGARRSLEDTLDKPYDPATLAGAIGLSEVHLRRRFQAVFGVTPRRYLLDARLRRARELLATTDLGVERIALEVGLASGTHFGKLFRHAYGCSPSDYRAHAKR
jgi:DNA-binding response OmpR family regulator